MASSPEGNRLTQQHRNRQLVLRAAALREVTRLWRTVNPNDLQSTMAPFAEVAAGSVQTRFGLAAAAATDYFAAFRRAEQVRGQVTLIEPEAPDLGLIAGQLRGAGLSGIINARRRGFTPSAAARNGLAKVTGTASNFVLSAARQVVAEAATVDPASSGFRRVTGGDPCPFCEEWSRVTLVDPDAFESHDHCSCVAEPQF